MSINEVSWEWLKSAPLPVVLAISLSCFIAVGGYARSIDEEVSAQKTIVAVAAEKAKEAADAARRIEGKIDDLLVKVTEIVAERKMADQIEAKKKKENK